MVELTIALAAASKAFSVIKSSIQAGTDAADLLDKLGSFYDAKDQVEQAKEHCEQESVDSYAMSVIEAEIKVAKYEEEVKKMFMAQGKTALYHKMIRIREDERFRRAQAKMKQLALQREKEKKLQEFKNLCFLGVIMVSLGGLLVWLSWTVSLIE